MDGLVDIPFYTMCLMIYDFYSHWKFYLVLSGPWDIGGGSPLIKTWDR